MRYEFEPFTLDMDRGLLLKSGEDVAIEPLASLTDWRGARTVKKPPRAPAASVYAQCPSDTPTIRHHCAPRDDTGSRRQSHSPRRPRQQRAPILVNRCARRRRYS